MLCCVVLGNVEKVRGLIDVVCGGSIRSSGSGSWEKRGGNVSGRKNFFGWGIDYLGR